MVKIIKLFTFKNTGCCSTINNILFYGLQKPYLNPIYQLLMIFLFNAVFNNNIKVNTIFFLSVW